MTDLITTAITQSLQMEWLACCRKYLVPSETQNELKRSIFTQLASSSSSDPSPTTVAQTATVVDDARRAIKSFYDCMTTLETSILNSEVDAIPAHLQSLKKYFQLSISLASLNESASTFVQKMTLQGEAHAAALRNEYKDLSVAEAKMLYELNDIKHKEDMLRLQQQYHRAIDDAHLLSKKIKELTVENQMLRQRISAESSLS
eukprot:PhF_6_TR6021/c0_g1_i2/m.8673